MKCSCFQIQWQIPKCRTDVKNKLGPSIAVVNWKGKQSPSRNTTWFGVRRMYFLKNDTWRNLNSKMLLGKDG